MKKVREGYKMTEFGEIPSEWNINLVKDITTEHKQGYYAKNDYNDNGTYLMRITDLKNQKINFKEMPRIEIDDDIYEQYKVELGDFLFARSGAIGRYGIYDTEDYPQAVFASYIIRFRFNTSNVNNKYFGYFYESNYCLNQLKAITQGSSNININANNIKDLKICLPPLKEQEKIALILSTVDEQIDNVDELIQKNKELKKGLMQQLLTKGIGHTKFKKTEIGEIPEAWGVDSIGNLSIFCSNGFVGTATPYYSENGTNYLMSNNVRANKIDTRSIVKVNKEFVELYPRTRIFTGDMLTVQSGHIGTSCVVPKEYNNCNCHALIITRFNKDIMESNFVSYYLNSDIGMGRLSTIFVGSTIKHINVKDLVKFNIPIPSIEEQEKISSILSEVDEKIEKYEKKKQKLEELKKGLMQQLLTGKIRVIL